MDIYVLNPEYYLVNDIKRIVITNEDLKVSFIHPLHAIILTYFDNELNLTLYQKIRVISDDLEIDKTDIKEFVEKLVYNEKDLLVTSNNNIISQFPNNVLIKKPENFRSRGYSIRDFLIGDNDYDYQTYRLYKPLSMTIVINTKCVTNCIYCYANREYNYSKNKLTTKRIVGIIKEAKMLNMINVEITGGELFLEKNYLEILNELISNGFDPKISTKIPFSEKQVEKLSNIGLKRLQFSIDCLDKDILETTLGVKKGYIDNILKTISFCKKHDIKIKINTIITKYNNNFDLIDEMLTYLLEYENVDEITIDYSGYSINNEKDYFKEIAPNYSVLKNVYDKLKIKYNNEPRVIIGDIESLSENFRFKEKDFYGKAVCSGNLFQFYLLPDGKTTLCEELYWHPQFILGDLSKQSIMEMWQGERALDFYNIKQEAFKKDSACKTCDKFDYCHLNASVCWKEVMETYGTDKWYYPDPRCPKAPDVKIKKYLI